MNHPKRIAIQTAPSFGKDLRSKQELLSAAKRCLEDERCYQFFALLDSLSQLPAEVKQAYVDDLSTHGTYDEVEIAALRRLILDGGAHAFKHLVDVVRDIRVQQEIDSMVA